MVDTICISFVEKIVEYTVAPIGRRLFYSCQYNSNKEKLNYKEGELRDAKDRVQSSVNVARRNSEQIHRVVIRWLEDVAIIELAISRLRESEEEASMRCSNAACLNLIHRHQVSRAAKNIVENIAQLIARCDNDNFKEVSYRPPLEGMERIRNKDYMAMGSRMTVMKGIMEALGNADIDKIGVWGMPGVGKTTLMKEIARQAVEEKLFNEVVMTVVPNNLDVRRIQEEIAEMLGLKFDQESEKGRACLLRQRLSNDKKNLIILDDICKAFDLQEIGIPSEGCKVVMTSRYRDVLMSGMDTQKAIHELKILRKEEAWNLFEKMAGDCFKDWPPEVRGIATKIAEKCACLPIALVTVSKALKNKSLATWKDALVQLTRPTPEHNSKLWSHVHSCIQLSYEHLDGEDAVKSLFLLCAQQGYYISYRDLQRYGFGLGLFHNIYTLEEARNRLESLVSNLLDSCLLLESPHSSEVFYMHDLVRDVATIIASKNHNMFVMRDDGAQKAWLDVDALNRCEALSIHGGEILKHFNKMECPKLRFFHVECLLNLKISDIFFQGMDKLEVLSLRRMRLSSLFPLTNLQTLCLDGCRLGDIHWIGELKSLLILSLAHSDISNLPREIESLTRLQLLDLSYCFRLRVIPPNVLSSLVILEELYMQKTEVQWELEGPSNEGKNASLAELKKLSHLTTLEIDIPNANNLPANLFSGKLERYKIRIGNEIFDPVFTWKAAFSRVLKLNLKMSFQLDFGIKMLLKRTEYLSLVEADSTKSVLHELHGEDFQQLKHLHIQKNGNIKHITELRTPDVAFFPFLETFILIAMISLEEICQVKLPLSSFKNLKVLKVENCEKLRFIFSSSIARGLSLLEELNITRCNNIGAIFVKEEEDEIEDQGDMMLFGRLQTLVLKDLPKLVGFLSTRETNSEGNLHDFQLPLLHHQVSFPSLQTLRMEGLPKIKHVWSCGQEPKTVFTCLEQLKILEISNCGVEEIVAVEGGGEAVAIRTLVFPRVSTLKFRNLKRLKWFYKRVHHSVFTCLERLKILEVSNCGVEEIVAVEGGGEAVAIRTLVFPRVSTLKFRNLKRLKWFYKGVHVSKWPMLKEMTIQGCHKVEIFASQVVSFEKAIEDQRQSEMSNIRQPLFSVDEHSFPSLEKLLISNMDSLEIIFGKLEGQNGKEPQDLICPASGTEESGATTHFVSFVSFPSLQTLHIKDLTKIKHVWSCGQEPKTVLTGLEQLQVLEIEDCGVEEIVAIERGGEAVAIRTLVFPQVTQLTFRNLPRLKWFYKGVHVSKWPMLKEMKIERCEKVEIFASEVVSFEKAVKDQRQFEMSIKQPLFSVNELSFPSLKTLEIIWPDQVTATSFPNIPNANNLPANLLFEKLERCKICIGIKRYHPAYFMGENDFSRVFKLKLNMSFRLDLGIKMLLKRTEYLYLDEANSTKSVLYELHREDFQQLKFFHIQNNGNIKHILESGTSVVAFPILETFVLNNMFSLEEICQDKLPLSSFKNLKVLKVENCEKLKFIFSSSIARGLSLLEELNITRCDNLGAIFVKEEEDGIEDQGDIMLFGRLQTLVLNDLPMLVGFLSTKDSFMADCRETNSEGNHDLQLPLLHHDQVSFPSLQTLCMWGLPKIKYVWSCGQEPKTVFTCLEQLKILEISNCGVEEIVAVEGGGEAVAIRTLVFPRVSTLKFRYLKRLKWFYKGVHVSKWPMLKEMTIHGCHKVEIFASKVVSFEKAIEDQRQSEMSNIKQPLFSVDEHSFPSLETLEFWNMDSLEIIFGKLEGQNGKEPQVLISPALGTEESGATTQFASTGKLPLIYFKNLKVLKVENCQKLRFVSSSSIAKVPSLLEKLKIKRCNNMGAIVVAEDKDGIEDGDVILFHQLQTLELEDLPELVSFFSTKSSFMTDCGQIITEGNHNLHMPLLPHQLCFPSVRELYLEGLPKIKHVWSKEPQTMFRFQALQDIYVGKCESLTSLFPAWVLRCLEQLKKIVIEDCGVEEIVAVEGGGGEAVERTLVFPRVSTLELRNLKRLKWFCKRVHVSKWPMLKLMKIEGCEEVEIFASGVVSFEETIKERQSEMSIKQPLFLVDELSFPSLKKLYIWSLDKLEIIWQDQVTASSFPNIQELRISDCDKLLHVFQSNLHTTRTLIQSLTSLHIKDCDSLETIFRNMEGQSGKESQVLIAPSFGLEESIAREEETTRHIEFPTLTEMSLVGLPKLKWILEGVHTNLECPSLKQLELGGFGRVINMIWASKFPRSSSSQENQLQTCVQQPIFEFDEATFPNLEILSLRFSRTICPSRFSDFPAGPSFPIIRLPTLLELKVRSSGWEEIFSHELVDREIRLRRLSLNHLPMLIHLWKEDGTQPCPLSHNLQFLSLSGCGKLKNIVPSSVSLHNLRELAISDCHGLINLLTSSTAKTLVQLSRMTVTDCKRITEIVAMEDGEANVEITFKNLVCLELDGLPNLTHFCSRPYSFGFPSLIEVIVRCCPEMKTFCHGVLSTPELTAVWDDRHRWNSKRNVHWEDDLNTTTRCLWESNQYDTQCLFRERVENSEEDENHPSEDEDHSENSEEG
ncbi:uncharacterized protein LOC122319131 isoform X2 [Carya illinoinensis]|uniref:AAA+ ATPase domain-containing protein n=1 Tax=Carya illinoinensis TaxID=32201 RepID=A0A8T1PWC0_CARIL|nr:uncharacterized protein LOC122319131 isoform X2 [Carya illinoinensis]XP_042992986.1 uncharacterized protein LOC122319131 isoform X2 [Carya illinoinensis]XP_042992987.1 uncharacterized protein LOC122319131 isoform X2 [Carya illinoinensis]XP_042992988.1 uncharacterized protein LOC122319131 isoform X2 [Carya illinoinensis]XP_042992989.1 uncharacterized protein LOC122319131 isoform X2 [Carya illinoinensis]KAG6646104.1 hypothetical protein CIPAW_08G170400 [Carya illinoinensis]